MTGLTKRVVGKGTRCEMEYEEDLMHNMLAISQNTVVSMANNARDNIPCIMMLPVIAPQQTISSNPASNPLYALLKVPNILVVK